MSLRISAWHSSVTGWRRETWYVRKQFFFFKYTGKLLKYPASANLKQFGLHLLSTLKCINSFRAFGTFHRLRDTADVSSAAASQALISVQIVSLLNSKSFSSKNSLIMQLQGMSRGGHSRVFPHRVIRVSYLSLAHQTKTWSASSPFCPFMFHANGRRDGNQPNSSWRAMTETQALLPGYGQKGEGHGRY